MRLVQEEIFGPLAPICIFEIEEEVVSTANKCDVGLTSYVLMQDVNRATRITKLLEFGTIALNTCSCRTAWHRETFQSRLKPSHCALILSHLHYRFGGIKHSGMGREGSKYGIEDYLQVKTSVTGINDF